MKKLLETAILSPEMHPDRVGERVAALRLALLLNNADFADSVRLDRSALSRIEKGEAGLSLPIAGKISTLHGVGLDYIYRGVITDVPEPLRAAVMDRLHQVRTAKTLGVGDETVAGRPVRKRPKRAP